MENRFELLAFHKNNRTSPEPDSCGIRPLQFLRTHIFATSETCALDEASLVAKVAEAEENRERHHCDAYLTGPLPQSVLITINKSAAYTLTYLWVKFNFCCSDLVDF
jgi:hypothetical protein